MINWLAFSQSQWSYILSHIINSTLSSCVLVSIFLRYSSVKFLGNVFVVVVPAMFDPLMSKIVEQSMSNSLIIHQVNKRKSQPWRRIGYPVLISIDFDDFTLPFFLAFLFREDILSTRDSASSVIQTPRISSKMLRCASYFQLSSRCLDIPNKHCLSCLIYYLKINQINPARSVLFLKIR